ncbi:hypothetical protein BDZ97DRAFT_1112705 [Flammula alnicola]|nr:hypothetical protein BDZ97DRAFT_1112705 [Flammula alnicola]
MAGPSSDFQSPANKKATAALTIIVTCNILEILGLVILIAILCTAWFSARVPRTSTWFLLVFSTILCNISSIMLLGQQTGPEPNMSICLVQAAMAYSTAVFNAFSGTAFVLQVYLSMTLVHNYYTLFSRRIVLMLNVLSTLMLCGSLTIILVYAVRNPSFVVRDPSGIRCHITSPLVRIMSIGISIGAAAVGLILQVVIGIKLHRAGNSFDSLPIQSKIPRAVIIRVFIFSAISFILIVLGLVSYSPMYEEGSGISDITLASTPLVGGIVFGTQKDILRVWMFWRRPSVEQGP